MVRRDAAALELEQKPQAGPQKIVEVLNGQRGERVWVERRRRATAKSRDELLLEKALACLVEHSLLARRADQVGELVEQARARAVKCADPGAVEDFGTELRATRMHLFG